MKKILIALAILVCIVPISQAQESGEKETKHLLTGSFGYTFIPKATSIGGTEPNGIFVPSIGLDYFYRVAPKWEIGTMIDLELGDYLIFEKDLEREKAMVVALIGTYKITKHFNLFAGGGIELERNHHLVVIRLGTEYAFYLNKGWLIAPGFFYDIKEGYDSWSLALAFGKEF